MKNQATISDIAKKFNLSIGTISKILNNKGSISEETRQKVLAYVKEINYHPTSVARNLRLQKTYLIGVVFSEELDIGLEHSFYASILQYFKKYVEKQGYEVSFVISQIGDTHYSYLEWCQNRNVDGVYIVAGSHDDQEILKLINSNIPCVTTEMSFPMIHSVITNNKQGIKYTLDYIKNQLKKTSIALVSGPLISHSFNERTAYLLEYAKEIGLKIDDNVEILENYEFISGYNATNHLLDRTTSLPEVIITSSDDIAFGVLRALYERHISVPNDLQVIGFDDVPYAERSTPALTTIRQNRKMLGETAGKILLDLINNKETTYDKITLVDTELIVRETTKE